MNNNNNNPLQNNQNSLFPNSTNNNNNFSPSYTNNNCTTINEGGLPTHSNFIPYGVNTSPNSFSMPNLNPSQSGIYSFEIPGFRIIVVPTSPHCSSINNFTQFTQN
ncbi:hypothetical protein RclHR1_07390007 [Rhizophagus clarus]|uniref:Uncharacterized protein n=1 Tax=Rhizophagus clarus TaxID=94130 RepID=A0A2Z6S302_9GLOM|nr:hypothetical protein RclHR1_07390007 [Rhizophagus clarus]GES90025.1 hypothetical protein GLOIN_2v1822239 [Rhizophagus clarus]